MESLRNKWLDDNCGMSMLGSCGMEMLRPDIGWLIKVDMLDVPKAIFPEEYRQVTEAYHSVIAKLNAHFREKNKKMPGSIAIDSVFGGDVEQGMPGMGDNGC